MSRALLFWTWKMRFLMSFNFFEYFFQKGIDKPISLCYNIRALNGRLAQLGEHLPYKQRVTGSSPVLSTKKIQMAL